MDRGGRKGSMLREGFSTGASAAAAAAAALEFLLGEEAPSGVEIPLLGPGRLCILVERCAAEQDGARAVVVKDAGDDPDATHGAAISALVRFSPRAGVRETLIDGGRGVGRVTLPGLPAAVGEAAINPGPREQIRRAVAEVLARHGAQGEVRVLVEVENGEEIARKTLNPRLGIVGGVSILGTTGVVRPLSHDAWKASVVQSLNVAEALGLPEICLATGRRSERMYLDHRPDVPEQGAVQAGDYFAFSLRAAAEASFSTVWWSVFFGKFIKQAVGLESTHAKDGGLDMGWLETLCREAGIDGATRLRVEEANTAAQALEMLRPAPEFGRLLQLIADRWIQSARSFAGATPGLGLLVFDFNGAVLVERSWTP